MQSARDVGRYSLSQLDVDGKPACVLAVARRREGFAQTSSGVVRLRRGTRDDPLFGAELVRFANERTSSRYETTELDVPLNAVASHLRTEIGRALQWSRATADRLRTAELASNERLTVASLVPCIYCQTRRRFSARLSSSCCDFRTTAPSTTTAATKSGGRCTTCSRKPLAALWTSWGQSW